MEGGITELFGKSEPLLHIGLRQQGLLTHLPELNAALAQMLARARIAR